MATARPGAQGGPLPSVIALNCLEKCEAEAAALADICVLEHAGLVEGMLEKIAHASVVILLSLQFLPRAAQRKLSPSQLLICLGASADTRAVESALAEELGLRLVHVDVPRAEEVADTVMALMLGLLRNSHTLADQGCTSASWHGGYRSAWDGMRRLRGLTLGLVGVNASGRAVARRAAAFGMNIVYCDVESELLGRDVSQAKRRAKVRKALQAIGKGVMTVREAVEKSDVISLHCSLTDDTLHLINDKTISYFKKGSMLVNASSCHLVSDAAIKRALNSGLLASCALDGVEGPQWMEAWVREFPKVLILPRSAEHSREAWGELRRKVVEVVRLFLTQRTIPSDAIVAESIDDEEAAWARLGAAGAVITAPPQAAAAGRGQGLAAAKPAASAGAAAVAAPVGGGRGGQGLVSGSSVVAGAVASSSGRGVSSGSAAVEQAKDQRGGAGATNASVSAASAAARAESGARRLSVESKTGGKAAVASGAASGASGVLAGSGSVKERVSFGDKVVVEYIQAAAEVGGDAGGGGLHALESGSGDVYVKQSSSNSLAESVEDDSVSKSPLRDGALIALRAPPQAGGGQSLSSYYVAQPPPEGESPDAPFALLLSKDANPTLPSAQFVVVCDNVRELLGCRSIFAKGRFLQARDGDGRLMFASDDLDLLESWFFQLDPETKHLRLTNAHQPKVVLEAIVEFIT